MISLIQNNPYLLLLITTTLEGPIATFVAAGLSAHHILRIEYVVIITILGDVIGDMALFLAGRYAHKTTRVQHVIHRLPKKAAASKLLEQQPFLSLVIAKFTPYLATPSLLFAGTQEMRRQDFLQYSIIISTLVKAVYITLGYLGAVSAQQLENFLSGRTKIAGYIIIGVICFWLAQFLYQRLGAFLKKEIKQ